MGYCADLVKGEPFTITDPSAVLDAMQAGEHAENANHAYGGHISWCQPIISYRKDHNFWGDCAALHDLLTDFGFETTIHLDNNPEVKPGVHVHGWGGDKIGSSWDFVWECLAEGTDDEPCWVMRGEDGDFWAETIVQGSHMGLPVTTHYEVQA